jgi:hypothetical protein
VQLPEELFANVGAAVGAQVNRALGFLQDVSCGRDLKQLLIVSEAVVLDSSVLLNIFAELQ